jgi:hypothetical protein
LIAVYAEKRRGFRAFIMLKTLSPVILFMFLSGANSGHTQSMRLTMKKQMNSKVALTASLLLIAGSQVQAADGTSSEITNPPRYVPHSSSYPTPPPGGWEGMIDAIDKQEEQQKQDDARGYMGQSNPWGAGRQAPPPAYGQQQGAPQQQQWGQQRQQSQPPQWGAPQQQQQGQQRAPQQDQWSQQRAPQQDQWGQQQYRQAPPPQYRGQQDWGYRDPYMGGPSWGGGPGYGTPSFGTGRGPSFKGPWDRDRGRNYPWGGRDMPWDSKSMPWDSRGGRGDWFSKDKMGDAWDDMINAPSDMGEMPGGWSAPSVSMPNPIDVGDEFEGAARDMPEQMRNVYDENRRYNSRDYRRY